MSDRVRVVIHTPELWPDIRESEWMSRAEAELLVAEINTEGFHAGRLHSPKARAYIGRKPKPNAGTNQRQRSTREGGTPHRVEPGHRIPGCIMPPRNVHASPREWEGERGNGTSKFGYRYERLTERWAER